MSGELNSGPSPLELADDLAAIERELSGLADQGAALCALTRLAVEQVPGAEYAGITLGRNGSFRSAAETDQLVSQVDRIQYSLGSGPCVDAILESAIFNAPDLRTDRRWPEFGRRTVERTAVRSMLSFRLFLEADRETVAALNMYAVRAGAFDQSSETAGLVLATAGALAVAGSAARGQVRNLEQALENSREIGIAIGILMSQLKVTRDQGFNLLSLASQSTNRKLSEVAADVVDTGALLDLPPRRS